MGAREAKTDNAKANILANFDGGDLSPRPAGILMRRRGVQPCVPFLHHPRASASLSLSLFLFLLSTFDSGKRFMSSREVARISREETLGARRASRHLALPVPLFFPLPPLPADVNREYETVKGELLHISRTRSPV